MTDTQFSAACLAIVAIVAISAIFFEEKRDVAKGIRSIIRCIMEWFFGSGSRGL
jgi:hypothetical protein